VPPGEAARFIFGMLRETVVPVTSHLLPAYARADLAFERGEGAWLHATNGERYLDFASGVAVNVLGHAHPHLVAALTEQAQKLWHTSNLYRIPQGERLAERLCAATFADLVFFANSGAEALECSIKTARKYHAVSGRPERYRFITFEGAFHGRTLATLAAGGQKKYLDGFGPVVAGFDQVPFADVEATKAAIGPETAAILIEPVQGEGGVRVAPPQVLRALRALCDQHGLLLVLDEVQCGVGRTGTLFAYQAAGITPDIMAIAKAIGGGFPLGACLATSEAAKGMTAGTHGSTFGGNPLAMAVGNAVLDVVLAPDFLPQVRRTALDLKQRLAEIRDRHAGVIAELRGEGLLLGLRTVGTNTELVDALRAEGMLTVAAGDNVVRLLPPLIIGAEEVGEAVARIDRACARVARKREQAEGAVA
jgi:acetylornithine/N-succinyldiaminopimelate aminotransferase